METEPIWIGSTYCTSSRINTLVLTLFAPLDLELIALVILSILFEKEVQ